MSIHTKPIKLSSLPSGTVIVKEYRNSAGRVTQVLTQKDQDFRMWVRVTFDLWEMVRESMILDYLELTGRDIDLPCECVLDSGSFGQPI